MEPKTLAPTSFPSWTVTLIPLSNFHKKASQSLSYPLQTTPRLVNSFLFSFQLNFLNPPALRFPVGNPTLSLKPMKHPLSLGTPSAAPG